MSTGNPAGRWLRYAPPVAALSVAFVLQVVVVTDVVGTALADTQRDTATPWLWYCLAAGFGVAVATSLEAGAAYLMSLYDRHLQARDSVWQLRLGMLLYVAVSASMIHWWLDYRGLPNLVAWVLAGMSASALWLWSRGSRWAQRTEMIDAGQIDPALPRLPTASKVMHPIRWVITLYLISWEPVATTGEARARYATWRAQHNILRRRTWGSAAFGPGTRTSDLPVPTSSRSAGARAAAGTPAGGSTSMTSSGSSRPPAAAKKSVRVTSSKSRANSSKRSDTELASLIVANGWAGESLNSLSSRLSVSKTRATTVRQLARQHSRPDVEPSVPDRELSAQVTTPNSHTAAGDHGVSSRG